MYKVLISNVTFITIREYTSDFQSRENGNFSEIQIRSSSQRILILFVFFQAETCRHFQSYNDSVQRGTERTPTHHTDKKIDRRTTKSILEIITY